MLVGANGSSRSKRTSFSLVKLWKVHLLNRIREVNGVLACGAVSKGDIKQCTVAHPVLAAVMAAPVLVQAGMATSDATKASAIENKGKSISHEPVVIAYSYSRWLRKEIKWRFDKKSACESRKRQGG